MSESPLILSVSGARGIVGESMTPTFAATFAAGFGQWVRDACMDERPRARGRHAPPHVVIGRDSRRSGPMLELAAVSGLLSVGCRVTRLGVATTPGVAVMTDALDADGGLVVTASHNPDPWNGLKPIRRGGAAPPPAEAEQIIERVRTERIDFAEVDALTACRWRDDTPRLHAERVARCVDREAIREAGLSVAVDSVHGAGGRETLALLEALGVGTRYQFHAEPTGRFPHPPEPTAEHVADFCREVARYESDVAFVQDPDADRLAILDEQGRYVGEEYTLALCARQSVGRGDVIAANLSTSRMIDDIAAAAGARVVRTPVGEANVAAAMRAENAVVGGEGNGGVILPKVSYVRDSLVGIALVLEMLAHRRQPLSEITREVPAYAIVKDKAPIDDQLTRRLAQALAEQYPEQPINQNDGVRVDWPDRWVHVRPSNTEPIVRLIAEARDRAQAQALLADVRRALQLDATPR